MKQLSLTFVFVTCFALTYGQKKEEINFSDPFQIDSSEFFLIPKLIDNDNQHIYGKGKGFLPWGNYSDIYFYNQKTNQAKKLFNDQLAQIVPFFPRRNYYDNDNSKAKETPANLLPKHIVYLVRTDNFSGDNALDTDDPIYLYISTKTGDHLRQITPKGFNVVSWTVSKENKMILVKGQNDKSGNRKFGDGDDQLYYRIDLHDDISKIQCYQISL